MPPASSDAQDPGSPGRPRLASALFERRHFLCGAAVVVLASILLGAMIRLPLTWGLMDDHTNLIWVRSEWPSMTLCQILKAHSQLFWFRPVYVLYVYVAYGLFQNHPKVFYAVNLFFVMGCCLPWVRLVGRHLAKDFRRDGMFLVTFCLFAWTSMSTLIVYLSLQEKFLILFGGIAFCCADALGPTPGPRRVPRWVLVSLALLSLTAALLTKPTALMFVPWLLLSLLFAPDLPRAGKAISIALLVGLALAMLAVTLRSATSYTGRYWDGWGAKLFSLQTRVYVFILLGIGTLALLEWKRRRDGPATPRLPPAFAWPVTLLANLILQFPWGFFSYNWTPAMVFASGCLALGAEAVAARAGRLRGAFVGTALAASLLAASAVTALVTVPRLSVQSELTPLVQWLRSRLPDPSVDVYVLPPMIEGTLALMRYTDNVQTFQYVHHEEPVPRGRPRTWLIASPFVDLGPLHQSEFTRAVFRSPHWTVWERASQ